jgi:hypothetical protein
MPDGPTRAPVCNCRAEREVLAFGLLDRRDLLEEPPRDFGALRAVFLLVAVLLDLAALVELLLLAAPYYQRPRLAALSRTRQVLDQSVSAASL